MESRTRPSISITSEVGEDATKKAAVSNDMSLGKVPPKEERLKDSEGLKIAKLCGESEWQPRFIVITADKFIIAHPDSDDVSDQIPLHEIKSCDKMTGHGDDIIAFVINTIENGYNCGRQYIFSVEDEKTFEEWDSFIEKQSEICFKRVNKHTMIEEAKCRARDLLKSAAWQYTFGFIIVANFAVNIGQACVDVGVVSHSNSTSVERRSASASVVTTSDHTLNTTTSDSHSASHSDSLVIFNGFDIAFTTLFSIELALNLFGNWFWEFVRSGWSMFDFTVVLVSIISLAVPNGPQWVLVLRTMRIFRILRLFRKMRALRTIINGLLAALPIVAQAFLIMALCLFVFAIVGQNLFRTLSPTYFGNFKVSLYTVFKILTMDRWALIAEAVKDTTKYGHDDVDPTSAIYFGVLIVTCVWVLLPVVVAVLLDNFVISCRAEEKRAAIDEEEEEMRKAGVSKANTLSPIHALLESLSKFKNAKDLSYKIQSLFQVLDCDRGGTLSFQEISEGLRRMDFTPPIAITKDDFVRMTKHGQLCDEEDALNPENFETMMRGELEEHIEQKVAKAYEESQKKETPESAALLAAVKLLKMLSHEESTDEFSKHVASLRDMQKEMMEAIEESKMRMLRGMKTTERKVSLSQALPAFIPVPQQVDLFQSFR